MKMVQNEYEIQHDASFFFLAFVGIFGIGLNCNALKKAIRACKTEQNMVLTNLIVSELLISAFGVPLDIIGLVIHGTSINGILCPAAAFIHTTLGMSSLFTIVTMAVIRYLSVVRCERKWHLETGQRFFTSRPVQLIWFLAFLMSSPPLLGMGKYVVDIGMISCGPDWSSGNILGLIYNVYLMFFGFAIPTCIIVFSNLTVICTSNKRKKTKLRWSKAAGIAQLSLLQETRAIEKSKRESRKQRKLTILLLSMTFAFYLTWTPYAVCSLLSMLGFSVHQTLQTIAILFAKVGTISNPILYIFFNKEISGIGDRRQRNKARGMYETTTDMVSKSQEIPPSVKIEKDLPNVIVEEVKQTVSSNNCIEAPKIEILRETKVSRSRSYHYALRKTIYINFTANGQSSYSFWNHAYCSVEKRNTYFEDRQNILLDIREAKNRSLISL